MRRAAGALLAIGAVSTVGATVAAPNGKHLGVASCASGVCHGRSGAVEDRDVALNEYSVWLQKDRHSQAYRALESVESRRIAANLGLATATKSKICLDCHADNVPDAQRVGKFTLTDGVGCEACHGGSEQWIEAHAQKDATHAANVARGMYPAETPVGRAELCLTCHAGTTDKLATHMLMGAGHPRLSFELDAFTANQPPHFRGNDPSYLRRKGRIEGANLWVAGQLRSVARQMTLLRAWWGRSGGQFPELAFYDCHACHHPMSVVRWSRDRVGAGIPPGSVRLQTGNLLMLRAIAETIEGAQGAEVLAQSTEALIVAGQRDAAALIAAVDKLSAWVEARDGWTRRPYSREDISRLRKVLIRYAATDHASDFTTAEQVVMGAESLSYSLSDYEGHRRALDALFDTVKSATTFDPARFTAVVKGLTGQF